MQTLARVPGRFSRCSISQHTYAPRKQQAKLQHRRLPGKHRLIHLPYPVTFKQCPSFGIKVPRLWHRVCLSIFRKLWSKRRMCRTPAPEYRGSGRRVKSKIRTSSLHLSPQLSSKLFPDSDACHATLFELGRQLLLAARTSNRFATLLRSKSGVFWCTV